MQYLVCFSGGHSSALVAIEAVRRAGKENVILLNHDVSSEVEHKDIKRFKQEVADYLGIPVTYANMADFENNTPIRLCKNIGAWISPANRQALCTYNLKTKPFYEWLNQNYPASFENPCEKITILYGFDANEQTRITRRVGVLGQKGYKTDFPLAYWERTILDTEEVGIQKPSTYRIFKHANCMGCLKAGMQHWYVIYCLRPDIYKDAAEAEEEMGYSIIKDHWLKDLEERFEETKAKGICPNDKGNSAAFWARVDLLMPEQESFLPCDCAVL